LKEYKVENNSCEIESLRDLVEKEKKVGSHIGFADLVQASTVEASLSN